MTAVSCRYPRRDLSSREAVSKRSIRRHNNFVRVFQRSSGEDTIQSPYQIGGETQPSFPVFPDSIKQAEILPGMLKRG